MSLGPNRPLFCFQTPIVAFSFGPRGPQGTQHPELFLPLSLLDATLAKPPISIDSKRLMKYLTSLNATLTKNRGVALASQISLNHHPKEGKRTMRRDCSLVRHGNRRPKRVAPQKQIA